MLLLLQRCTRPAPRRLPAGAALMGVALLFLTACSGLRDELEQVAADYTRAVHEFDGARLIELSAPMRRHLATAADEGAARSELLAAFEELQARYRAGRDSGLLEFDPEGIILIRALNLGDGAFYETVELQQAGQRVVMVQEVRLAYRSIDVGSLPYGTTIYLLGAPLGTIYSPTIGAREPAARTLLEKLWVRWEFVREDEAWRVETVRPDSRPPVTYEDTTRF